MKFIKNVSVYIFIKVSINVLNFYQDDFFLPITYISFCFMHRFVAQNKIMFYMYYDLHLKCICVLCVLCIILFMIVHRVEPR